MIRFLGKNFFNIDFIGTESNGIFTLECLVKESTNMNINTIFLEIDGKIEEVNRCDFEKF